MSDELHYLSASDALSAFADKTLSPVEYMKAIIDRCEAVNPKLNAFTYTFFDQALEGAKTAESRYVAGTARPLEGLPLAVKDTHPVKGEISTAGSRLLADFRPEYTAPATQRLFDAGAIMHARTTAPEFAHAGYCYSALWGITRNPWNLDYGPGGSSGGAAASLAAGMTAIADGTDGGGSIRIPASACGIVGYKPPFGRNPLKTLVTDFELLVMIGPLGRNVEDVRLMQNVMVGPHMDDITSLHPKLELPEPKDIKGWRIAYSPNLGYVEVDEDVRRNTEKCVETFRSMGCQVDEVDVGWDWSVLDAWQTHWEVLSSFLLGDVVGRGRYEEMHPFLVKTIEKGKLHLAGEARKSEIIRTKMWQKLAPIMSKYDVMICPTLAVPSVMADHDPQDLEFRINGRRVDPYVGWYLTYQFNLLSQLPVISVPSGLSSSGVPTGLQIVGRPYDDISVFHAAAAFEKVHDWNGRKPAL